MNTTVWKPCQGMKKKTNMTSKIRYITPACFTLLWASNAVERMPGRLSTAQSVLEWLMAYVGLFYNRSHSQMQLKYWASLLEASLAGTPPSAMNPHGSLTGLWSFHNMAFISCSPLLPLLSHQTEWCTGGPNLMGRQLTTHYLVPQACLPPTTACLLFQRLWPTSFWG